MGSYSRIPVSVTGIKDRIEDFESFFVVRDSSVRYTDACKGLGSFWLVDVEERTHSSISNSSYGSVSDLALRLSDGHG